MDRGLSRVSSGSVMSHPNLDRYYGELIDYIPQENGHVNINMKRTAFGIKIITKNFTQGTIIMKRLIHLKYGFNILKMNLKICLL